jgi:hypothetical protein
VSAKTAAAPAAAKGGGAKGAVNFGLCWTSFIFALVGGAAMLGTFVGDLFGWAGGLKGITIKGVPVITLVLIVGIVILGLAGLRDILRDNVPNRTAVWAAILVPCLARGAGGWFATKTGATSQQVVAQASPHAAGAFNVPLLYILAIVGVLGALVLAKGSVKPGSGVL